MPFIVVGEAAGDSDDERVLVGSRLLLEYLKDLEVSTFVIFNTNLHAFTQERKTNENILF